jgi:hypothetical protein
MAQRIPPLAPQWWICAGVQALKGEARQKNVDAQAAIPSSPKTPFIASRRSC